MKPTADALPQPARHNERYTHAEWLAEGVRRFGDDYENWRFTCPVCGNVASIADFKRFKPNGATPESATSECIGRYTGAKAEARPCNYAGYGLIRISPVRVVMSDEYERHSFAFAPVASTEPQPITTAHPSSTKPPAAGRTNLKGSRRTK